MYLKEICLFKSMDMCKTYKILAESRLHNEPGYSSASIQFQQ